MAAPTSTDRVLTVTFPSLQKLASGKVRDLFLIPTHPDRLLFTSSDRISAYDVVLASPIPRKGQLLTLLSAHWFDVLPKLVPGLKTHFITLDLPAPPALTPPEESLARNRSMQVRKLRVLPVEAIVRGYITGSAWKEYSAHGTVHSIPVPAGLRQCERFPEPLYTPSTKAEAGSGLHDENIHPDEAHKLFLDVAGGDQADADRLAEEVRRLSLATYRVAAGYAAERGVIIADTKFEFALDDETKEVVLVDEVLTPDSSRFWDASTYETGRDQDSFDKQFLRNWLVEKGLKGKDGVEVPDDVATATAERYEDVFFRLTGKKVADVAQ